MPCSDCNSTLAYHLDKELLYCPNCLQLPVADDNVINHKAEFILDNYLNHSEFIHLIEEFGSVHVIASLLNEMNGAAFNLTSENGMPFREFLYTTPLLKSIYEHVDSFESHFKPDDTDVQDEVDERISGLLDAETVLVPLLKQIQEDFVVALEQTPGYGDWNDFYGNHEFLHTEYWLCAERCMRANIGARYDVAEDYEKQQELFRSFDRSSRDEIDSVRDYGDFWYGFIANIGFAVTLQKQVQEAYTTDFPDSVTIFDFEEFRDCIDKQVEAQLTARTEEDYRPASLRESDFNQCGEDVFGDNWDAVKESILVTESNVDAHPLYFRIQGKQETKLPQWRSSRAIPVTLILYPDYYTMLLERQIYPLLKNGDGKHSRQILAELTGERGNEFEQYIYEFLSDAGVDAWFSCKTSKHNGNEVDVIFVRDEVVYFVEVKFVLPTLNILTQAGIQNVNETFDEKIFNRGINDSSKSFPEKIDSWRSLDVDSEILHQPINSDQREWIDLPEKWLDYDHRRLVVSNFVPSYIEKQEVHFITDLELYLWIKKDKDVFYSTHH